MGLGVIMILLNTAVLNGHSSMLSITSFPKNDIRDLRQLSISEAVLIVGEVNSNASITDKAGAFNLLYGQYVNETINLYHIRCALVNISYQPCVTSIAVSHDSFASLITSVTITLAYSNSDTIYREYVSVGT